MDELLSLSYCVDYEERFVVQIATGNSLGLNSFPVFMKQPETEWATVAQRHECYAATLRGNVSGHEKSIPVAERCGNA